jgi:serine/threonine protein kinase/Tol biopolymer transport system component
MPSERQHQITALYHAALEHDSGQRAAFLHEACAGDDALRRDVESLLGYEDVAAPFLEQPAMAVAAHLATNGGVSARDLAGHRLGVYKIETRIGAGGMGEVYRARDTKLGRDVAIKVLPPHLIDNADRRARFEREARLLATLNHPHIAQVYGLEESDGLQALVMQLVPGETLDAILDTPPRALDVADALSIARQIAEALNAAHQKGIIHRDLKPGNIMVEGAWGPTPAHGKTAASRLRPPRRLDDDLIVKVLDFGLAKMTAGDATGADLTQSPANTAGGTGQGVILGTPAYMSPEQARGQPVDKRTDIWASGCVLYEMLTGRPAFTGQTVSDTIAAILEREPDWKALPAGTPRTMRLLLERCLRKDVRRRLHDIADARIEIEEAGSKDEPDGVGTVPPLSSRWRRSLVWALGVVAVGSTAALMVGALNPRTDDDRVLRFDVLGPAGTMMMVGQPLSPDGRTLAFVTSSGGARRIWVRPLDSASARPLPGTEGASRVFWSPDSRRIAYYAQGTLRIVSAAGGPSMVISTVAGGQDPASFSATWSVRDVILVSWVNGPILRVPAGGGEPTPATELADKETSHNNPEFLPDGRHFFYTAESADGLNLCVGTLDSKNRHGVPGINSAARYSPTGHVVFLRNGTLMARAFDPRSLQQSGDTFPISEQIFGPTTTAPFSISSNGSLAYQTGESTTRSQLVWLDRSGKELAVAGPKGDYVNPELSPDGRHVAFGRGNPPDIWIRNLESGIDSQFSFHRARDYTPIWSPDGKTIAFYSEQDRKIGNGIMFTRPIGVAGDDKLLWRSDSENIPADWSRDGQYLAYTSAGDVWALSDPLSHNPKPQRVTETAFNETNPRISPDGRWIAYESTPPRGQREVYIQSFPQAGTRLKVSNGCGLQPRWRRDSKELFYVTPDFGSVMAVTITPTSSSLAASTPVRLFPTRMFQAGLGRSYSVASDGRFLVNVDTADETLPPITVLHNWAASLRK